MLSLTDVSSYLAIDDWSAYLEEGCVQEKADQIKANTMTGRPSGSDSFASGLEKMFGVRLKPLREGRPRNKK